MAKQSPRAAGEQIVHSMNFHNGALSAGDRAFDGAMAAHEARLDLRGLGIKKFLNVQEMSAYEYPKFSVINLSSNLFLTVPLELAKVTSLRDLSLDNNIISSLPHLNPFHKLQHLSLCHNAVKTIPSSIGDLIALETLNLAYNALSTLPSEMSNLRLLKYLGLEGNRELQTLSLELSRMTGTQIKIDGLLHVPGELDSPLRIVEWIENLNLLGLPVNQHSHWRTSAVICVRCKAPFNAHSKLKQHNCRVCGHLTCTACCSTFLIIPCFNLGEGVRVCTSCSAILQSRNYERVPDPKKMARPPKPAMQLPEVCPIDEEDISWAVENGKKTIKRMEQSLMTTMLHEAAAMELSDKLKLSAEAARIRQALAEVEVRYRALMGSLAYNSAPTPTHSPPSSSGSILSIVSSSPTSLSLASQSPPASPRWKAASPPSLGLPPTRAQPTLPQGVIASAVTSNAIGNPSSTGSPRAVPQSPRTAHYSIVPPGVPVVSSPVSITSPRRIIRSQISSLPPPPTLPVPPAPSREPPLRMNKSKAERPPSLTSLLAALSEEEIPGSTGAEPFSRPPSDLLLQGTRDAAESIRLGGASTTAALPAGTLHQMRAKWTYKGMDERELRFKAGDVIVVLEKMGSEWYFGIANGRSGFFPASHVVPLSTYNQ